MSKKRVRTHCRERVRMMFLIALGEKKKRVSYDAFKQRFWLTFEVKKNALQI